MPELSEISYSRDATIRAFRDYYRFLADLYMEPSSIIEPPTGGWPTISPEFQHCFGKSDEVIALLRNMPYIRDDAPGGLHAPHGTPTCCWADWQAVAAGAVREAAAREAAAGEAADLSVGEGLRIQSEGGAWEDVPAHVIGLTFGGRDNPVFLLDTRLGIVHWPESDGGGGHRHNFDGDASFVEPVVDDADEYAPENEVEWRNEAPAWAVADFFELLKSQFRRLDWIPTSSREVIDVAAHYDASEDGMIPMLQGIFREHGWSLEHAAHYRKRECLEAVKTALEERYPSFEGF